MNPLPLSPQKRPAKGTAADGNSLPNIIRTSKRQASTKAKAKIQNDVDLDNDLENDMIRRSMGWKSGDNTVRRRGGNSSNSRGRG